MCTLVSITRLGFSDRSDLIGFVHEGLAVPVARVADAPQMCVTTPPRTLDRRRVFATGWSPLRKLLQSADSHLSSGACLCCLHKQL